MLQPLIELKCFSWVFFHENELSLCLSPPSTKKPWLCIHDNLWSPSNVVGSLAAVITVGWIPLRQTSPLGPSALATLRHYLRFTEGRSVGRGAPLHATEFRSAHFFSSFLIFVPALTGRSAARWLRSSFVPSLAQLACSCVLLCRSTCSWPRPWGSSNVVGSMSRESTTLPTSPRSRWVLYCTSVFHGKFHRRGGEGGGLLPESEEEPALVSLGTVVNDRR